MKPKKNAGVEILIAEDSTTQAEDLRYLLEQHGHAVLAQSIEQFLRENKSLPGSAGARMIARADGN